MLYLLPCLHISEPASLGQLESDTVTVTGQSHSFIGENDTAEELKVLTVSSSHSEKPEAPVSSSAHESRYGGIFFTVVFVLGVVFS